jgi:hypothetical protein
MLKLIFYVPVESAEMVKAALFKIGAGKIGNYDQCSFETIGIGQFRPLKGATPNIGELGILEKIPEAKVEMVIDDIIVKEAIRVLNKVHPYETPAYQVLQCLDV